MGEHTKSQAGSEMRWENTRKVRRGQRWDGRTRKVRRSQRWDGFVMEGEPDGMRGSLRKTSRKVVRDQTRL